MSTCTYTGNIIHKGALKDPIQLNVIVFQHILQWERKIKMPERKIKIPQVNNLNVHDMFELLGAVTLLPNPKIKAIFTILQQTIFGIYMY